MATTKSDLNWSNITRNDMSGDVQQAFDLFLEAKKDLESKLALDAQSKGYAAADEGFAFSYRSIPDAVGMAITGKVRAKVSGYAGLKLSKASNLAEFQRVADAGGHRR